MGNFDSVGRSYAPVQGSAVNHEPPHFRSKDASAPTSQPEPPAPLPVSGTNPPSLHEAMRPLPLPPHPSPTPANTALPQIAPAGGSKQAPLLSPPMAPTTAVEPASPWQGWVQQRFGEIPSWAVSFIVHLSILLILALMIVKGSGPGGPLSLTLTMGPESGAEEDPGEEAVFEAPAEEEPAEEEETPVEEEPAEEIVEEVPEEPAQEQTSEQAADSNSAGGGDSSEGSGEASGGGEGSGGDGQGISFMGIYDDFESVAYVVDCSGSMEGPKLDAAKYELIRSIESLGNNRKFIICFFDNDEFIFPDSGRLLSGSQVNVDSARRWILGIQGGGGTNPDVALVRAFHAEAQVVYFMTDGEVNSEASTRALIARRRPASTIIHTIGFDSTLAAPFLQEIAQTCDGTYRFQVASDLGIPGRKPLIAAVPQVDIDEVLPDILVALRTGDENTALLALEPLLISRFDLSSSQVLEAGRALTARLAMTDPGQTHFQFENALLALAKDEVSDITNPESWEAYWDSYALEILESDASSKLNQADALRRRGRFDVARQRYQEIIAEYPETPSAIRAQETLDDASLWRAPVGS